jgi:hypothetical protein
MVRARSRDGNATAERSTTDRAPAADRGLADRPGGLDRHAVLALQRMAGNRSTARLVQRQVKAPVRDTKHPENFATYEEWLATFGPLSKTTFTSRDKAPTGFEANFSVLGDKAASRDPKAAPADRPPDPIEPRKGDKFIDHPTDAWVTANLPEELRQTAYRLPSDCADIAVILRHVWLFAHRRRETQLGFVLGFVGGESGTVRSRRVRQAMAGINTPNVHGMVNPYTDASGKPLRSISALAPLLHPGDILVWAHHAGPDGSTPDPTRPRSGGHTQTVVSVERDGGRVKRIVTLQGNQPLPRESGSQFRWTPGRRIEVRPLIDPTDLTIPARGRQPAEQVWDFGDRHTTLVAAGPPRSGERPAAKKENGTVVRRLADWLPSIAAARRDRLEGVFEAAMREGQAMLERGDPPAEVEGEARSLGRAVRARVDALDAQDARSRRAPDPTTRAGIVATLGVLASGQGSTRSAVVARVFTAVKAAFDGTVPQPGWAGVGPSNLNAGERMVGHVRRIPLDGLPGATPRAVVALPAGITGGPRPVEVLLHFHGDNGGAAAGRDITVDRVAAQIEASGKRMLAVLPQSPTAKAGFGAFDVPGYLTAVFSALTAMRTWTPAPPRGTVVLAGHSAGGRAAAGLMTGGPVAGVSELALFDGVNGPVELGNLETFVLAQLNAAAAQLKDPKVRGNAAKEDRILAGVIRLRAYHTGSATARPTRKVMDYPGLHATLRKTIDDWFAANAGTVSSRALAALRARFQVIATGHRDHERIVGKPARTGSPDGALLDALKAP